MLPRHCELTGTHSNSLGHLSSFGPEPALAAMPTYMGVQRNGHRAFLSRTNFIVVAQAVRFIWKGNWVPR